MGNVLQDVRYSVRALRRTPTFAAVVIITLTLGFGANLVVFSVICAVLLQPLAVRDPASLYQIRPKAWTLGRLLTTSYPAFEDLRRRNSTFSDMAAIYAYSNATLRTGNSRARKLRGEEVTGELFRFAGHPG